MNDWRLKGTCPEHPPRPAEVVALRLLSRHSGFVPDAEGEQSHPAGHGRGREGTPTPLPALTSGGLLSCATTDPGPGGHPRKQSAGVSSQATGSGSQ